MKPIFTGTHGNCHIQGFAVDDKKHMIYYSFTTKLVKSTLDGEIVGSVDGLTGHLGCIDFCRADGRVYGSLEYKNDVIGRGIRSALGVNKGTEDGFYIAIFDVDKIDRMHMDAEADGIMTAVYLHDVVADYKGQGQNQVPHRYGCSGIDGTAFGPIPGDVEGRHHLFVSYGIYGDTAREDNDHQVLLCFDTENWKAYEQPLSQSDMHHSGPERAGQRFFVYTGNTTYGVQNLEYDAHTNYYFMAVYRGQKAAFPNYDLYAVDAKKAPVTQPLRGLRETGAVLSLASPGQYHEASGVHGWRFPYGSTGLYARGNGQYLISQNQVARTGQCSFIYSYVFDEKRGFVLDI
ncbi:MAG: hypothetical protein PHZ09_03755 [Eubacteriales bacterium]|nr:hypothetical protein [Eubacteriales bacterium]